MSKFRHVSDAIKQYSLAFVTIMETGKKDLSKMNQTRLSGSTNFIWHCLPSRGRSSAILLGVNAATLVLSFIVERKFCIKFHLCNKVNKFKWILGLAQDGFKSVF